MELNLNIIRLYIYTPTYRYLFPERARLVHTWSLRAPTWAPPPTTTCRRDPFFPFFLVSCAWVYPEHGTGGESGAVAGVSRRWRVEGGLEGARSPLSWFYESHVPRYTREASMGSVWPPYVRLDIVC